MLGTRSTGVVDGTHSNGTHWLAAAANAELGTASCRAEKRESVKRRFFLSLTLIDGVETFASNDFFPSLPLRYGRVSTDRVAGGRERRGRAFSIRKAFFVLFTSTLP